MNSTEMKNIARNATINALMPSFEANDAVQSGTTVYNILQTVEGVEFWTEVTVKVKKEGFDPYEAAEEWKADQAVKAAKAAEKAEAKAKKIAADEAKRAKKEAVEAE